MSKRSNNGNKFGPRYSYVLDGGFGSLLESLGYDADNHDLWSGGANFDHSDLVYECHKLFINAGANVILTNTYHCSIQKMEESMSYSREQAEDVLIKAVDLARKAIVDSGKPVLLFGSIGPYATYLRDASEYSGSYINKPGIEQTIIDYYLMQCRPIIKSDVKCLVFETIPTLKEVECVGKVLEQLDEDVQAIISVTCEDGSHTRKHDSFRDVVKTANKFEKVLAIGVNCTSPLHITKLLQNADAEMRSSGKKKPLVVYPNSGEVYNTETKEFEGDTQIDIIVESIPTWYDFGARLFGGCCRVMPEHIKKIADACENLNDTIMGKKHEFEQI